jgi:hypothetical protein
MTLRARVARVDDYSEELIQALDKLAAQKEKGALDRAQQDDFVLDLRRAMVVRDLQPLRRRAGLDLFLAVLTAGAAVGLHRFLPSRPAAFLVLLVLCAVSLGLSLGRLRAALHRQHHDLDWLAKLQARVAAGGTIFD